MIPAKEVNSVTIAVAKSAEARGAASCPVLTPVASIPKANPKGCTIFSTLLLLSNIDPSFSCHREISAPSEHRFTTNLDSGYFCHNNTDIPSIMITPFR